MEARRQRSRDRHGQVFLGPSRGRFLLGRQRPAGDANAERGVQYGQEQPDVRVGFRHAVATEDRVKVESLMESTPADSPLVPGIMMTLGGMYLLVSHRRLARQYVMYYQAWPAMHTKMLEWSSLVGGALAVITGIALFAYPEHVLASILFLTL